MSIPDTYNNRGGVGAEHHNAKDADTHHSAVAVGGGPKNNAAPEPMVQLPKGGGAIRGIGETFESNPANGTLSASVPIAMSKGRSGFSPSLLLSYNSGSGNSPYGLGWSIGLPSISRKTDKGIPRYAKAPATQQDEDTFLLSGTEDLVRQLDGQGGLCPPVVRTIARQAYDVYTYLPRTQARFDKIEKWVRQSDKDIHWRTTSKDNVSSVYGQSALARIADPADSRKVFKWLIERSADHKGNLIRYTYKPEDGSAIHDALFERHRLEPTPIFANTYLKRVQYANATMAGIDDPLDHMHWHMQLVLDYGEHQTAMPTAAEQQSWACRPDPFSTYTAAFEIRTWRLCQRFLMFHHFAEQGDAPVLVKSTELSYNTDTPTGNSLAHSLLTAVCHKGHRAQTHKAYPPLVFSYSQAQMPGIACTFERSDMQSLQKEDRYQWIDLYNEGLQGLLLTQDSAWYYTPNLGDKRFTAPEFPHTALEMASRQVLDTVPSMATANTAYTLGDLDGNGHTDISIVSGELRGFQELKDDGEWDSWRYFKSLPNIDWQDPNLRMIDLTGDGHADILISEQQCFSCYFSKAKEGYAPAVRVSKAMDERQGPRLIFNDSTYSIFTADMSGDGLSDLVRIRNGSVDYWPNMGYGRFGRKVSMQNAPRWDYAQQFDPNRLRLADIDGTGTTDIIYLGHKTYVAYNLSGNGWTVPQVLKGAPPFSNHTQVQVLDLLGKGSSCLVWTRETPYGRTRLQYIELTGGIKPWLLTQMDNQMGGIHQFEYAPSTKFYIQDKKQHRPWISKLPFPVQVLEKAITIDEVTQSRYTKRYAYHHGYFDGQEREFRGFGMVEQWDTDSYQSQNEGDNPPVYTKTWFHTGYYKNRDTIAQLFAQEYFQGDANAWLLPDTQLPTGLTMAESREACRVLKGSLLRQEVYALDGSDKEGVPYSVTENSYKIDVVQALKENKHAVFTVLPEEIINFNYERAVEDPRIVHMLNLEYDHFGNPIKQVSVAYKRFSNAMQGQDKTLVSIKENTFFNTEDTDMFYRLSVPIAVVNYETHHFQNHTTKIKLSDFANYNSIVKTRIQAQKTLYLNEACTAPLALGQVASHALPYKSLTLAMDDALINQHIAANGRTNAPSVALFKTMLRAAAYESDNNNEFWMPSERAQYDITKFYMPMQQIDALGNVTHITYDAYNLLISKTTDALNFSTQIDNDYIALQAIKVTDPNGNGTQIELDALGMPVKQAVFGADGEGDSLAYPTQAFVYHLDNWRDNAQPISSYIKARTEHGANCTTFIETYEYTDGLGRTALIKTTAEEGLAWQLDVNGQPEQVQSNTRWTATGRTIYNNKGKVFKQYEPWFSTNSDYESETELTEYGVSLKMFYDPLERLIETIFPDQSRSSVEFNAWQQKNFDQNDNDASSPHYNTPQTVLLTPLGKAFKTIDDNGSFGNDIITTQTIDILGQLTSVEDALGRAMTSNIYDYSGQLIMTSNIDSGKRWLVYNAAKLPIYGWDSRNHRSRTEYDALLRPLSIYLQTGTANEQKVQQNEYGTSAAKNNIGQIESIFDQSGKQTIAQYDFKGNPLQVVKQFCEDYQNTIDWHTTPVLKSETYTQQIAYDAMNRPLSQSMPDGTVITDTYNKAGLLESVTKDGQNFVKNINYNAKGQRTAIYYGNNTKTKYEYDINTFRLIRLLTTRNNGADILQDLHYTYDPVGNITQITDNAQQTHYFNNAVVEPKGQYEYDALYRLTKATGRELTGLQQSTHTDFPDNIGMPNTASNAMQNYTQQFQYDELGNILQMKSVGNWTRDYFYNTNNNYLQGHTANTTEYTYDQHGNMLRMPHLSAMVWDYKDELKEVVLNANNDKAYYVYDATGERVRKVVEKGNVVEERYYLSDYELYRKTTNGTLNIERKSLFIKDDTKTIAQIDSDDTKETIRYQYDNHLGSASLELDKNAAIISYEEYHPFGTTSYRSGRTETEVSLKRYKYTDKERDEETGLYYYGARYYAGWIGRFVSVDPLATERQWLNPYNYVQNNPLNRIDLNGALDDDPPKKTNYSYGNTSFDSKEDMDFVIGLTKKSNKFKRKFKELSKSDRNYHFKSFKHGDLTDLNGNFISGVVQKNDSEPNRILINFTKGDSPNVIDKSFGQSKYHALAEETYHAWDYEKKGLDINHPTATDEAQAWKFAAQMPETNFREIYKDTKTGESFNDYTVMYSIYNSSEERVAKWFKFGMPGSLDSKGNSYNVVNAKGENPRTPKKGLYHFLKLK